MTVMSKVEITYCNRAYGKRWFRRLRKQNPEHFRILWAIIDEIEIKDGGEISKQDIFTRKPQVAQRVTEMKFDIIPSRGQLLKHNSNGIRHAKYCPSKSIAVLWENIGGTIYVTFDDHAPIRYHRAISHLRDIKLGNPALPKKARISGRFLRQLRRYQEKRHGKGFRRFDPKRRYYE